MAESDDPDSSVKVDDAGVLIVDCGGLLDLDTGLSRLQALGSAFAQDAAGGRRKLLIDFRRTVWANEDDHRQLSIITRRDFGLNADNRSLKFALVNNVWAGEVSANEHWFLNREEALQWLWCDG